MYSKIPAMMLLMMLLASMSLFALTPEEIMREADAQQTFETSVSSGEFRITDRFGVKVTTFNAWSRGADESLIEFTSIAERGQKILRTRDSLYLYYPDAEELIRMQGSALRQSMLGSDISYEDMTGNKDHISHYEVVMEGEDVVNGRPCYVLHLSALTRTVPYPQERVWIDKESYIIWRGEYSTKSGRLLKEIEVLETRMIDGREIAVKTRISDKMKKDSETLMILTELHINVPIDERLFSIDELSW